MSDTRSERFEVQGAPSIDVQLPAGHLEVTQGDSGEVVVEVRGPDADRFEISRLSSGTVLVRAPERRMRWQGHRVLVRVGAGASLDARMASADVAAHVDLAELDVRTASGDVVAGAVTGSCQVATASGDVRIGSVGGTLAVNTASGDVAVDSAARGARLHSASGDMRVGAAARDVDAKSASGDIEVDRYTGDALDAKTMSGDVRIGLPAGRNLDVELQTLSGKVRTPFEVDGNGGSPGPSEGRVTVRTVSGDVTLVRAAPDD